MTIIEAVLKILQEKGSPMTPREILGEIQRNNFYTFHTQDPLNVVRSQMRRHSVGYDRAAASSSRHLELLSNDQYRAITSKENSDKIVNCRD